MRLKIPVTKKWLRERAKLQLNLRFGSSCSSRLNEVFLDEASTQQKFEFMKSVEHNEAVPAESQNSTLNSFDQSNFNDLSVLSLNQIECKLVESPAVEQLSLIGSNVTSSNSFKTSSLREDLRHLVNLKRLRTDCVERLLKMLYFHGHDDLPLTYRALMGTPRFTNTCTEISGGDYYHVGLYQILTEVSKLGLLTNLSPNVLSLTVHIDGISFSGSSSLRGWPITASIDNFPQIKPFVIGIFSGYVDPQDFDEFLTPLVKDLEIAKHGYDIFGQQITVIISKVVSDSMARLKFTHSMGPASLKGCFCCNQVGIKLAGEGVQYNPEIVLPMRTNESFRSRSDEEHHHDTHLHKPGVFESQVLGLDMVMNFPIDPMHCCDSGSSNRIIKVIFINRGWEGNVIPQHIIEEMNLNYINMYRFAPLEITRKPRDLIRNFSFLKATECRNFTLYYGIVILRLLSDDQYQNFLMYSMALRLYSSVNSSELEYDLAHNLMQLFLSEYQSFYGYNLTFNLHMQLHLRRFVGKYGDLYSFFAYKFENFLREVKDDARMPHHVIQQISRRLQERGHVHYVEKDEAGLQDKKTLKDGSEIYELLLIDGLKIRCDDVNSYLAIKTKNNCLETVKVKYFKYHLGKVQIIYNKVETCSEPYFKINISTKLSLNAHHFGILTTKTLKNNKLYVTYADAIVCKYVAIPDLDITVLIPFLHIDVSKIYL